MPAKLILNPYAARWGAGQRQAAAETALRAAGVDFETVLSDAPGHCTQLAVEAARQGFDPIIAGGGDGTISEIVNGILAAKPDKPPRLGILPLGTANDTAVNLKLPEDLEAAATVIAGGRTRQIDLCEVNGRYFINNAGLGLEPYVTTIQQRIKAVKGIARYLLATLIAIGHNPQWRMRLEWDGGSHEGPCTLVSVSNSPLTGGVFYTVPHADPFDGKLSFVYGYLPSRLKILATLPKTMKPGPGNYVEHPAVHEVHASWLRVEVQPGSPAHADGELFADSIQKLDYRIHPARLPILLGA
ncbi:MAG: diacylglycerol kinase family lipid kinase [Anaerolineales bacterium]|nr:diacylglycerol kinase family lipid kinase [Anaerolineales bacterium]